MYPNIADSVQVLYHHVTVLHLPPPVADGVDGHGVEGLLAEGELGAQALELLVVEVLEAYLVYLGRDELHQLYRLVSWH